MREIVEPSLTEPSWMRGPWPVPPRGALHLSIAKQCDPLHGSQWGTRMSELHCSHQKLHCSDASVDARARFEGVSCLWPGTLLADGCGRERSVREVADRHRNSKSRKAGVL